MGLLDFLKKKEKVVEKPVVFETPKVVEFTPEQAKELVEIVEPKKVKTTKKLKVPVDPTLENCNKAVVKVVAKEFHEEAIEIIQMASEEERKEFLKYFDEDKGNICCLVLDTIKRNLISKGKLVGKDTDAFGKPFML